MKRLFLTLSAALALSQPLALSAAEPQTCEAETCFTADEAKAELETLYSMMRDAHFDMFARVPEAEYRARFEKLKTEVDGPVSKTRLLVLLQQTLAIGNVGHARTMAPLLAVFADLQSGGSFFPLSVIVRDGKVLLDQWADDTNRFPPGSAILAMDGQPIAQWLGRLRTHVSADNERLFHSQLEQLFPLLLKLEADPKASLELEVRWPDGSIARGALAATDYGTYVARRDARPPVRPARDSNARMYRMLEGGIAYLQPGPFFNVPSDEGASAGGYTVAPVEAFYTEAFDSFAKAGARELIIDLRSNPGGDNSFSDPLVARFADRDFAFASTFTLKASAATKARHADNPATDELGRRLRAGEAATPNGEVYEVELPRVQPRTENRFDGPVYVLIDRNSYSNASVMAAQVKDYGFGTIIGEETADLPTTYGSVEKFRLPLTGAEIDYPKSFIVRPSGAISVRGVVPDIELASQPLGVAEDRTLENAVALVVSRREEG